MCKKQSLWEVEIQIAVYIYNTMSQVLICVLLNILRWSQVFQRRADASEDFYRDWNTYKNGFGSVNRDFWLGNDHIHSLTSHGNYILRIDMENFNGETRFAEYVGFSIDTESSYYTLRYTAYLESSTAGVYNRSGSI